MTGSIAVTRPLAGACAWIWLPRHTWLTGSRFETTTSSRPASCWPTNCFSRASVHTLSPDRRSAASCCAAAWARCMLRARRETSRASGPNRLASATLGGGTGRPLRSARVHSEIGHRPRDAHLHHERGDDRDDRGEHEEPDRAVTPPVPLDLVQMRGVEEHRDRAHRLVVVDERRRVHEPVDVAEHAEALGREV